MKENSPTPQETIVQLAPRSWSKILLAACGQTHAARVVLELSERRHRAIVELLAMRMCVEV